MELAHARLEALAEFARVKSAVALEDVVALQLLA